MAIRLGVRLATIALAAAATPRATYAQEGTTSVLPTLPPTAIAESDACLAAIPASAMTRVAVFAVPSVPDSAHRAALMPAANLLQAVVDRARTMLGAAPNVLPQGEPSVSWRELGRGLIVTGHRDGRVTWRVEEDSAAVAPPRAAAAELLARALEAEQASGAPLLYWPESLAADSVTFRIDFVRPVVDGSGTVQPVRASLAVPLLSVKAPREETVGVRRPPRVRYPERSRMGAAIGTVILEFVVDTAGRPEPATMRDLWPRDRPRPTGDLGHYYANFVAAVRSAVEDARYTPARIGGCVVRQVVQQPFDFKLR